MVLSTQFTRLVFLLILLVTSAFARSEMRTLGIIVAFPDSAGGKFSDGCLVDVRLVANALKRLPGAPKSKVLRVENEEPDSVLATIQSECAKATEADLMFLYVTGHVSRNPVTRQAEFFSRKGPVAITDIGKAISTASPGRCVLLLNCCRPGDSIGTVAQEIFPDWMSKRKLVGFSTKANSLAEASAEQGSTFARAIDAAIDPHMTHPTVSVRLKDFCDSVVRMGASASDFLGDSRQTPEFEDNSSSFLSENFFYLADGPGPSRRPQPYFTAISHYQARRYEEALKVLEDLAGSDEDDGLIDNELMVEVRSLRCLVYAAKGDFDRAFKQYDLAKRNPASATFPPLSINLARGFQKMNEQNGTPKEEWIEKADDLYKAAADNNPGNSYAQTNYARFLDSERGRMEEAEKYHRAALAADPDNGVSQSNAAVFFKDRYFDTSLQADKRDRYLQEAVKHFSLSTKCEYSPYTFGVLFNAAHFFKNNESLLRTRGLAAMDWRMLTDRAISLPFVSEETRREAGKEFLTMRGNDFLSAVANLPVDSEANAESDDWSLIQRFYAHLIDGASVVEPLPASSKLSLHGIQDLVQYAVPLAAKLNTASASTVAMPKLAEFPSALHNLDWKGFRDRVVWDTIRCTSQIMLASQRKLSASHLADKNWKTLEDLAEIVDGRKGGRAKAWILALTGDLSGAKKLSARFSSKDQQLNEFLEKLALFGGR